MILGKRDLCTGDDGQAESVLEHTQQQLAPGDWVPAEPLVLPPVGHRRTSSLDFSGACRLAHVLLVLLGP